MLATGGCVNKTLNQVFWNQQFEGGGGKKKANNTEEYFLGLQNEYDITVQALESLSMGQ